MSTYLVSRPGRPLHLAVFPARGPAVPICGIDSTADNWQLTGPWAEKWDRHKEPGLCFRCDVLATNLIDAAEAVRRG